MFQLSLSDSSSHTHLLVTSKQPEQNTTEDNEKEMRGREQNMTYWKTARPDLSLSLLKDPLL